MNKKTLKTILFFLSFLSYCQVWAQAPRDSISKKQDLKIGLVLSGGGAKCIADIGVLKVIEEAQLKIDYISGTSMGAIIGAMYSLGYTVDEIEFHMKRVDWDALLNNEIPRNRLNFQERQSDARYLLTFPIIDGQITLPTGLNYAQYILKELSLLTQSSYKYESFAEFPIPFLCVATNLESGELVVFEEGRLIDALRASSAFPSLFTPYEIDEKLYVDGGVVNNFPVEPLLDKGMDIIIAVDVQHFLYSKEELSSVIRILEQTSSFTSAREYLNQLQYVDVWIRPNIEGANVTSFNLFDTLVNRGEAAARAELQTLKSLAAQDIEKPINRSEIDALPKKAFYINDIIISGNKNSSDDFIIATMRINAGDTINSYKLDRGVDLLYGTRYFETVDYTIAPADTGYALTVKIKEDPSLASFKVGIHYDDDFKTALLLNYTRRNLLFKNSRLTFDFAVSENPRMLFNYRIDRGLRPSLGLKFRSHRFETRIYNNGKPVNELVYLDYSLDVYLQSTLYEALAVGGGIQLEGIDLSQSLEVLDPIDLNNDYLNYHGFLDFDSYNDANYPESGIRFFGSYRIIARHDNLGIFYKPSSVISASYSQAFHLAPRFTLIGNIYGAGTIGPSLDYQYNIFLGSMGENYINYIYPFVGYRFMELIGRNALVAKAEVQYQFIKDHFFLIRGNIGKLDESFDNIFSSDILLDGFSLGYSFNSPIGPLEANVMGSTNHSNIYTYVSLGFWF